MDEFILIRTILLLLCVLISCTLHSHTGDVAGNITYDNTCPNLIDHTSDVQKEISSSTEAIRTEIEKYKRNLMNITTEINRKLNYIKNENSRLQRLGNEKNNNITFNELSHSTQKLEDVINKIRKEAETTIDEQKHKLQRTVEYLTKKIICAEEVGFENMRKKSDLNHTMLSCGGVYVSKETKGLLQFRFNDTFSKYRKCIWTLRIENFNQIRLKVLADTFTVNDSIMVNSISETYYASFDSKGLQTDLHYGRGSITLSATGIKINHGNRTVINFLGPFIFITFDTQQYNEGSGFLLQFEGVKNPKLSHIINNVAYLHSHSYNSSGSILYPATGYYPHNLFWTLVIQPSITSQRQVSQLKLEYTDIEDELNCDSDALQIYKYDQERKLLISKRYCKESHTYTNETIMSLDGTFIITFISDGSSQLTLDGSEGRPGHEGFQFSWNSTVLKA